MNSGTRKEYNITDDMREKLDALADSAPGRVIFTPEMEAIILEYYPKKNKVELAKLLGLSRWALQNKYRELTNGTR